MPGMTHWIGQFLLAAASMFALLVVVYMLRGTPFANAWVDALTWAVTAAAIFAGSRYRQALKGAPCALCGDDTKKTK